MRRAKVAPPQRCGATLTSYPLLAVVSGDTPGGAQRPSGPEFEARSGGTLLPDPFVLDLYGEKTDWLVHTGVPSVVTYFAIIGAVSNVTRPDTLYHAHAIGGLNTESLAMPAAKWRAVVRRGHRMLLSISVAFKEEQHLRDDGRSGSSLGADSDTSLYLAYQPALAGKPGTGTVPAWRAEDAPPPAWSTTSSPGCRCRQRPVPGFRFYGVLAPNAKLRPAIVPSPPANATDNPSGHGETPHPSAPVRLSWARLLKRVSDIDIEQCPRCGGALTIHRRHPRPYRDCQDPRASRLAH